MYFGALAPSAGRMTGLSHASRRLSRDWAGANQGAGPWRGPIPPPT